MAARLVGARGRGRPLLTHLLGPDKKVAIIGTSAESLQLAPWDDPSWVFWVHSSAGKIVEAFGQADVFIDIHPPACFQETRKNGFDNYYKWLQALTTPILMQQAWPEIPAAIKFPNLRIKQQWPYHFGSQAAAMVGLAMYLGAKEIGFWGVDYTHDSEYARQRAHTLLWIGMAIGRGIRIVMPPNAKLLTNRDGDYGYESHDTQEKRDALKKEFMKARNANFDAAKLQAVTPENAAAVRALRAEKQPEWAKAVAGFGPEEQIPQALLDMEARQREFAGCIPGLPTAEGLPRTGGASVQATADAGPVVGSFVGRSAEGEGHGLVQPGGDVVSAQPHRRKHVSHRRQSRRRTVVGRVRRAA